ncbi:uncharacterized protein LOC144121479 [Amblyomma americanum]
MAQCVSAGCRSGRVSRRLLSNVKRSQKLILASRTLLSEAYYCRDAWNKRMDDPLLRNTDIDRYFVELSQKFGTKLKASAVDVDIYLNKVTSKDYTVEFENVLNRHRRTRQSANTLPSTHAAAVRYFLDTNQHDVLMRLLPNRLDYGIFPDTQTFNILMDTFIKLGNHRDAVKVAIEMMLQENTGNDISKLLALYSCHSYLRDPKPEPWDPNPKIPAEDEDDDEEIFVRVPKIPNPFFDDHFDLNEPDHLIGKTLMLFCGGVDDLLHRSYFLVGCGLYQKWNKCVEFLESLLKKKSDGGGDLLTRSAVKTFREAMDREDGGLGAEDERRKKLESALAALEDSGGFSDADAHELLLEALKKLPALEQADIEEQKRNFELWQELRHKALEEQTQLFLREKTIEAIRARKKELREKEELLYAFENWDKLEMELANVEAEMKELAAREETAEEYFPPDIRQPFSSTLKK